MKCTIKKFQSFQKAVDPFLTVNVNVEDNKVNWDKKASKFDYAVSKVLDSVDINKIWSNLINEINIKYAEESEKEGKKVLIVNEKGEYFYNKENSLLRLKELNSIDETEIEYKEYYATSLPDSLKKMLIEFPDEDELFCDFVILKV